MMPIVHKFMSENANIQIHKNIHKVFLLPCREICQILLRLLIFHESFRDGFMVALASLSSFKTYYMWDDEGNKRTLRIEFEHKQAFHSPLFIFMRFLYVRRFLYPTICLYEWISSLAQIPNTKKTKVNILELNYPREREEMSSSLQLLPLRLFSFFGWRRNVT